jgi:hypothetical protein
MSHSHEDIARAALKNLLVRLDRGELRVTRILVEEAERTSIAVEFVDREPPLTPAAEPPVVAEPAAKHHAVLVAYRPPTPADACRRCGVSGLLADGYDEWVCTACKFVFNPTRQAP